MHKNKIFPHNYLTYINKFTLLKEFSSDNLSLLNAMQIACFCRLFFFKACPYCTSPSNTFVVNIGMHVRYA